jgi:hypothetical protein
MVAPRAPEREEDFLRREEAKLKKNTKHIFTLELNAAEHRALLAVKASLGSRTKADTVRRLIREAQKRRGGGE